MTVTCTSFLELETPEPVQYVVHSLPNIQGPHCSRGHTCAVMLHRLLELWCIEVLGPHAIPYTIIVKLTPSVLRNSGKSSSADSQTSFHPVAALGTRCLEVNPTRIRGNPELSIRTYAERVLESLQARLHVDKCVVMIPPAQKLQVKDTHLHAVQYPHVLGQTCTYGRLRGPFHDCNCTTIIGWHRHVGS